MILITDGIDSLNNEQSKKAITKKLLSSDINVHVISYTLLQKQGIAGMKRVTFGRIKKPPPIPGIGPPEGSPPIGGSVSINMDREMIRHRKKEAKRIVESEEYLTNLAKDTNGEIFIPETTFEMMDKMERIAKYIDSQYLVTYTPNKSLAESSDGEVRNIKVTSKKSGVYIQSSRKYVVSKDK